MNKLIFTEYTPKVIEYLWRNLPYGNAVMICGKDIIVMHAGSILCH